MVVDPQRTGDLGGGEPASGFDASELDARLDALAQQASAPIDPSDVLSPSSDVPNAPSGEPVATESQDVVATPSPDARDDDPALDVPERREGESRAEFAQRSKAWAQSVLEQAQTAEKARREAEEQLRTQSATMQERHAQLQEWLGPRDAAWDELEQRALDGDWEARDQLRTFKDRRQYEQVIRLSNFSQIAAQLELAAKEEGVSVDDFRAAHGNDFPTALGVIVRSAVTKVATEKDAAIAKLTEQLKNEQTAHKATRDKALAGGVQTVTGGRSGDPGPLGHYLGTNGIPTDEAIEAALEGRLSGLRLG